MSADTGRRARWAYGLVMAGAVLSALVACVTMPSPSPSPYQQSPQFRDGRFHNVVPRAERSWVDGVRVWADFLFNKPANTRPDRVVPMLTVTREAVLGAPDNSVWRLGHSSLLFKLNNKLWLTDPVFSERSSPVQWYGPQRFDAPPIAVDELPPLEGVIISHNHYDHLDHATIMALQGRVKHFLAPLGVGATLIEWGVPASKVQEFDWWDGTTIGGVRFVATPAQHFSGRGLADADRTLWSSWVIAGQNFKLFFSGDSGYFDGFREIGKRYGPFDMAFIETGAYDKRWEYVHMLPDQVLKAFTDLDGKWLFPIHNGTFDLAMHAWNDPMEQITDLAAANGLSLSTPLMGERMSLSAPTTGSRWWQQTAQR